MATVDELMEKLLTSSQYNKYSEEKCYRDQLTESRPTAINVIEDVYIKIITTLSDTATQTIPTMHPTTLKHWWNDELESLKDNARSSHNAWFTAGKPNTGMLWETEKHDKYAYMLAIKKLKNIKRDGINETFLLALNNTSEFWKLWKSKLGNRKKIPECVNGKTSELEIAEEFAKYFATVSTSNSVERSTALMNEYNERKRVYNCDVNLTQFCLAVEQVDMAI